MLTYQKSDLPKGMRELAVKKVEIDADRNGQRGQCAKHARIVMRPY
jgi:hypothetical protein